MKYSVVDGIEVFVRLKYSRLRSWLTWANEQGENEVFRRESRNRARPCRYCLTTSLLAMEGRYRKRMKVVGGRVCARCRTTVGTSLVGLCSVIFAVVVVLKKEVGSWDLKEWKFIKVRR